MPEARCPQRRANVGFGGGGGQVGQRSGQVSKNCMRCRQPTAHPRPWAAYVLPASLERINSSAPGLLAAVSAPPAAPRALPPPHTLTPGREGRSHSAAKWHTLSEGWGKPAASALRTSRSWLAEAAKTRSASATHLPHSAGSRGAPLLAYFSVPLFTFPYISESGSQSAVLHMLFRLCRSSCFPTFLKAGRKVQSCTCFSGYRANCLHGWPQKTARQLA